MYNHFRAPFYVRVWRDIVWYAEHAYKAFIEALPFGVLLVLLPIVAGFVIG
jgi:hypothetical protein